MKIAVFSGGMIEYSLHEAIGIAHRLGADGIEIAVREPHLPPGISLQRVKEIKALLDGHGLAVSALAGYMGRFSEIGDTECEREFDDFRRVIPVAHELSAALIRVQPGGPNAFLAHDYHYAKAAYWLSRCAEEAASYGVGIAVEIHNQSIVETADDAVRLMDLVGSANAGVIHDAGNMYITGTDYGRDSVHRLGNRLVHVHVKDELRIPAAGDPGTFVNRTVRGEEAFLQCLIGEGEVDHLPLFETLAETGYDGWITLECFAPFPAYERYGHDLKELRHWLENGHTHKGATTL
jgi:L-ribulose-5-phosphate 3-epimerase